MSESNDNEDTDGDPERVTSVAAVFDEYYHVPVLATVLTFMLWLRVRTYESFLVDGNVLFRGNDAYYHYRQVEYTVRHWPSTMPYDAWTRFPSGTSQGQFGTLFDQFMATVALIVGLGDPTSQQVAMVALFTPAVVGTAVAIPVYKLGTRFGGRGEGLFAVFLLSLLPGEFLRRGLVGFTDHHVAEVFMMTVTVLALVIALQITEREKPVYEQALDRDWQGMSEPIRWSAIAGFAFGLYMWVWPPAVVLAGIAGLFFLLALTVDYLRGRSPDHVALVGIVSMTVASIVVLVGIDSFGFDTTTLSLIQFVLPLAVAAGAAFMAGLARVWDANEIDTRGYPIAIAGVLAVVTLFVAVALPDLYANIANNIERTILLDQSDTARTVGEAQSLLSRGEASERLFREYGMLFFTTVLGLVWMLAQSLFGREYESSSLFLVVWTVFLTLMAFTQIRFNYYLAVAVVVVNAWLFKQVADLVELPSLSDRLGEVTGYQLITLLAVFTIVFVPLATPLAATTAWESSDNNGPGRSAVWTENGEWMQNNTPAPGQYGDPDGEPMEYYGTYPNGDYDYPRGAYGVLSWWDYGHWITVQNERIPVANPFQQNARHASAFFQAQNESRASLYLKALPSMDTTDRGLYEMSEEQLRSVIDDQTAAERDERVRYIMIDDQTAGRKFPPVTVWTGPGLSNYVKRSEAPYSVVPLAGGQGQDQQRQVGQLPVRTDAYQQTMLSRLYFDDSNGLSHFRLVHEVEQFSYVGGYVDGNRVSSNDAFQSIMLSTGNWSQVAGIDQRLQQARQFAQFGQYTGFQVDFDGDGRQEILYDGHIESSLKTYEYVPGAEITGQVENENATVVIGVPLEVQNTGRTFQYRTTVKPDEDGSFSVTVPYATTDYLGVEEGATNSSVRAQGSYNVTAFDTESRQPVPLETAEVNVSESAVVSEDSDPIEANLERTGDPVEANATANRSVAPAGEPIEFSANASSGLALQYQWTDAVTSTNRTVTRSFDEPGEYTVELTVTDAYGETDTDTVTVEVVAEDGNETNESVAAREHTEAPRAIADGLATVDRSDVSARAVRA